MKYRMVYITCSIFFLINVFCVFSQDIKRWEYPVKPGMEEWKKFQSNEEMVTACQIPEAIISSLSTEELMEVCLQYPLLNDIFAFDNSNLGLDKLFRDFNGIRELYKRMDVSIVLTKKYNQKIQSFSFLDGKNSEIEKGYFIISVSALELLLSRIEQEDKKIYKDLIKNLIYGYEEKSKYINYFKGIGLQTNVYSRGHVISKIDKLAIELIPQKGKTSIMVSGMADEQSIRSINELSYQLIK